MNHESELRYLLHEYAHVYAYCKTHVSESALDKLMRLEIELVQYMTRKKVKK